MSLVDNPRERPRPIRRGDGRVPPHNLSAEESLLGALLLSRDAVGTVAELGLSVNDFYKPAHQYVYDAIRGLNATGHPVDAVTVADELRRAGLLDEIGGSELLLELQNATPAISNAARYAKIVQDTAVLRRLIGVAGEIAEIGYNEPDDVSKALDEAETKVFELAEDRVTDSVRPLGDLMPLAMDKLQETFERGNTITGLATGYNDLDDLLSGLQPSTLNIVGARPAMGKCVAWDTPIVDPRSGVVRTAQEWYRLGKKGCHALCITLDGGGRMRTTPFANFYDDGPKPLFRVITRSGRMVRLTAAHPLLTPTGWRPLEDIVVGTHVAVPTELPIFGQTELTDDVLDALAERAEEIGGIQPEVFSLSRRALGVFLDHLGVVDGSYSTPSEQLSVDVAHLLLRLGRKPHRVARFVHTKGGALTEVFDIESMEDVEPMLPIEVWDDVAKEIGERSWRQVRRLAGESLLSWHPYRRPARREAVARLAEALDSDVLRFWASPDVSWDEIVDIEPCGVDQVYDFNVPVTHNFVAADFFVHNTAFGLGMAVHVAQAARVPVLVFSLEMGHAELTQRILSSEARVDSSKLRNGRLSEADWTKLGRAVGRLEVPLYLDDNPRVTVMEIRAKARRLKARGGLGLIVIDYLQLMSGNNTENRQLEVSEISRGLKILARELGIPIVALSQLSRNLESRGDKRPMLADLRESGCLTADTRLVRADTNEEITLGSLVESGASNVPVWSLDERYRLVQGTVTNAFSSGRKEVFRLRLAAGRTVDASANHPFLTIGGWQRVDSLHVDDHVATSRRLPPSQSQQTMSDAELILQSRANTNVDVIPRDVWDHVRYKALPAAGLTARQLAAGLGMSYCGSALYKHGVGRERMQRVADVTNDPWLGDLATSDVFWDRIVAIEPLGEMEVFDATVEPHHNFIANGVVAHNSLEQDADVVMFLYRDEVYNSESADKGSAEVIIAKHRSGPIGMKRLAFLGTYTRFENMARGV